MHYKIINTKSIKQAILIGFLFLASCSPIKLGYDYVDWVILWKLDDFFELTSEQKEFLNPQVDQLLNWHKTNELPLYVSLLRQVQEKAQDRLTEAELDWIYNQTEKLGDRMVKHVAPDFAVFLASLEEEQIERFSKSFLQMDEQLKLSSDESQEKLAEATIERAEEWLGNLSDDQKEQITQLRESIPDISAERLDNREKMMGTLVVFLRQRADAKAIEEKLLELMDFESTSSVEYDQLAAAQRKASNNMLLAIDQMLTHSQRTHFLQKLDNLIEDVEDIQEGRVNRFWLSLRRFMF